MSERRLRKPEMSAELLQISLRDARGQDKRFIRSNWSEWLPKKWIATIAAANKSALSGNVAGGSAQARAVSPQRKAIKAEQGPIDAMEDTTNQVTVHILES